MRVGHSRSCRGWTLIDYHYISESYASSFTSYSAFSPAPDRLRSLASASTTCL